MSAKKLLRALAAAWAAALAAWLVFGWKLIPQGLWERLKIRKKE